MQVKLLYNLVEELAGEETGTIAEILFNKKDVNEFKIAKKMEFTINRVRNILYKLSNHGLVSFIRKKDNKKGWYIYFWTLNTEKCLVLIQKSLEKKIESLSKQQQSREIDRYYICKSCDIEVQEEQALENGFSCEECAEVYELAENTTHLRDTKSKITRTKRELETIENELKEIRKKEKKKRERIAKKAEKEAEAKKVLLKEARAVARKKVALEKAKNNPAKKKVVKKPAKKKVVKKSVKKKGTKKLVKKKPPKKPLKKVAKKPVKKPTKKTIKKK